MAFTHHDLNHWLHIKPNKKEHVVMSLTIFQLAVGVSSIFVPILLYDIGYSLRDVCLFYVLFFSVRLLYQFPLFNYIVKYGVNHSLALGYTLASIYILGVYIAQWHAAGLLIAGIFGGAYATTLWSSRHVDLVRVFGKKKMSSDVTYLFVLGTLATFLGPIVGGLVSEYFGPGYALLLTFALIMVAINVIHREIHSEINLKAEKIPPLKLRVPNRDYLANFSNAISANSQRLMWPIYVFIVIGSFSEVGFLFAIGTLVSVPFIKFAGRYNQKHGPSLAMTLGSIARGVISALRPLANSFGAVLAINLSFQVPDTLRAQSYVDIYYRHAQKHENHLSYIRSMEMSNNAGSIVAWTSMFLLIPVVGDINALKILMLVGAVAAFTTNLINHD